MDQINTTTLELVQNIYSFVDVPFKDDAYSLPIFVYSKNQEVVKGFLATQKLTPESINKLPPAIKDLYTRLSSMEGVVFVVELDYSDRENVQLTYHAGVLQDESNNPAQPSLRDDYGKMLICLESPLTDNL